MSNSKQENVPGGPESRADGPGGDVEITTLSDLLRDQLRDIYSVESQLIPALAELEALATAPPLCRLIRQHIEETRRQKERLEEIGRARSWDLSCDPSKAMEGLIAGGRTHVAQVDLPAARDFLIVAHTHRIKHYELAAYAITVALANRIGLPEQSALLRTSRQEEQEMDESLTHLAATELLDQIPSE